MDPPEHGGVEPRLKLVECTVVGRARVLLRDDGDAVLGHRRIDDLVRVNEEKPIANLDGEPLPPVLALGNELHDLLELIGAEAPDRLLMRPPIRDDPPPRAFERDLEPRRVDRLQQIVDGIDLERFNGVLIVRRHEDDLGGRPAVEQPTRHLETGQPRHLDIEEDDVGLQSGDRLQRLRAVARLADDLHATQLDQQKTQLIARQRFIVDDDRCEVHSCSTSPPGARAPWHPCPRHAVTRSAIASSGISTLAHVPWPGTLVRRR